MHVRTQVRVYVRIFVAIDFRLSQLRSQLLIPLGASGNDDDGMKAISPSQVTPFVTLYFRLTLNVSTTAV